MAKKTKYYLFFVILLVTAVLVTVGAEALGVDSTGRQRLPIREAFKPDRYRTNWILQSGGGTWSGVYRKDGWLEEFASGDPNLDISCEIELHCSQTFVNNIVYFHVGNLYNLTQAQRTAYIDGTFSSNNGMYAGICFEGTGKTPTDMLTDESGNYTGEILNAMVGTVDVLGRDISSESFNIKILMSEDSGTTWQTPDVYGADSTGTIVETLWWLIADGGEGTYNLKWSVEILPDMHQADGNYRFDPVLVVAPLL